MKLPFLYKPPSGTPPVAAAVSSAKFSDCDTCVSTTNPEFWVKLPLNVVEPDTVKLPLTFKNLVPDPW